MTQDVAAKPSIWVETNNRIINTSPHKEIKINNGIYELAVSPQIGFYFRHIANSFTFPNKIYELDKDFINKVVKSYNSSPKNIGVLLNGIKGGGKTFTAKMIAEQCGVPIIIIDKCYEGISRFLSLIDFNCVIFIDEYEKVFSGDERGELLSVMDGLQTSNNRIMFLLTTNNMSINENLINRPSRIRYVKNYSELSKSTIIEIIDDRLNNKEYYDDTIETISLIKNITLDSVIEIINEINLHDEPSSKFISYFNVNQGKMISTYVFNDLQTGQTLFKFKTDMYFSPSTTTNHFFAPINRYELELRNESLDPLTIIFRKHIDYGKADIEYLNPEYVKLNLLINRLDNELAELDESGLQYKQKEQEYNDAIAKRSNTAQYLTASVSYNQSFDKTWQFH